MKILRSHVFQMALVKHPAQKEDIVALLSLLSRAELKTTRDLQALFPYASYDETGMTQIGFAGSYAGGNMVFKGRFNYTGQFVMANEILPAKS
ncbi:hypothetical protein LEW97_004237 [Salmonella enterica]|nr:hypothetical protein [Salmonella enterica]EKB4122396.1 hypothetical protein [Salmonella enterica]